MDILFINGSPNPNGKGTAALAQELLKGKEYETLNLTDYRINCYGQELEGDQLDEVISKMKAARIIIVGSPLYWHNICGSVRNLLDRFWTAGFPRAVSQAKHCISCSRAPLLRSGC